MSCKSFKQSKNIFWLIGACVFGTVLLAPHSSSSAQTAAQTTPIPISIDIDGYKLTSQTTRPTIDQALLELLIEYDSDSIVTPDPSEPVSPNLTIYVKNKTPYVISADGVQISAKSFPTTVALILEKHELSLDSLDTIEPHLGHIIQADDQITITRFSQSTETITEIIPYATIYRDDDSLFVGEQQVSQQGQNGSKEIEVKKTFKNDELESEEKISETISQEPIDEIIDRGTKPVPPEPEPILATSDESTQRNQQQGKATWYETPFGSMSAASRDYPYGTRIKVTSQNTGRSIEVVVRDWVPDPSVIIDLSPDAFTALGRDLYGDGIDQVCVEPLQ